MGAMIPIADMAERLRALDRAEFRALVSSTNLCSRTIRNIRKGVTVNPRVETALTISKWLEQKRAA